MGFLRALYPRNLLLPEHDVLENGDSHDAGIGAKPALDAGEKIIALGRLFKTAVFKVPDEHVHRHFRRADSHTLPAVDAMAVGTGDDLSLVLNQNGVRVRL